MRLATGGTDDSNIVTDSDHTSCAASPEASDHRVWWQAVRAQLHAGKASGPAVQGGPAIRVAQTRAQLWRRALSGGAASKTKKRGSNPRLLHTTKPDAENLAKAALDALTGFAWNDDKQVCDLLVRKRIAAADESPHVVIDVSVVE